MLGLFKRQPAPEPAPAKAPAGPVSVHRPDGRIVYVLGATGSGKTTWVRQQVRRDRRLLVWDGKEEWGAGDRCRIVTSPHDMRALVLGSAPARVSYRVPVSRKNFETFCRLAWIWIRSGVGTVVIEELADVTTPAKAPVAWGEIVRKSRGYGATVYALTQRPQEVDKTVQGNAALVHCGMLPDEQDQRYAARRLLSVEPARVAALRPMQWIERDARAHTVRTGVTRHTSRK